MDGDVRGGHSAPDPEKLAVTAKAEAREPGSSRYDEEKLCTPAEWGERNQEDMCVRVCVCR